MRDTEYRPLRYKNKESVSVCKAPQKKLTRAGVREYPCPNS